MVISNFDFDHDEKCITFLFPNLVVSITSLRFSPHDNTFISGERDKKVVLWNADSKCKVRDFKNRPEEITHLRFSPDGNRIFSVDKDGKIYVFDINGEVKLGPLKEHDKAIESLGFIKTNQDREVLVIASRDRFMVWQRAQETVEQITP